MTCEDCLYYNFCKNQYGDTDYFDDEDIIYDVEKYCGKAEDKSKYTKLPFIAMIEQFIKNGKFDKRNTTHNGKYAVVYMDKSKWGIPIIDITSKYYNAEEAEKALKEYNDQLR